MIFAIVPAYNEIKSIRSTIEGLLSLNIFDGILVIDDGSSDGTARCVSSISDPRVSLSRLPRNRGKGAALNHAMNLLKDKSIDIFVFCDADLGTTSREISQLIRPIQNGQADFTTAIFPNSGEGGGFGLVVKFARWIIWAITGETIEAPLSGQRAFRSEVWRFASPCAGGFGAEVVFTARALKAGFRLLEITTGMRHRVTKMNATDVMHRAKQLWEVMLGVLSLLWQDKHKRRSKV